MSRLIEDINRTRNDNVKSTKDLKETLKHETKMFNCEEHVTLRITPKSKKSNG